MTASVSRGGRWVEADAGRLLSTLRLVSPIRRIPIPRLRRSIDRQWQAEARVRWMEQVQAVGAPVVAGEALHKVRSNSRSR